MFVFQKIWLALFSLKTRIEIRPFALLPTICANNYILLNSILKDFLNIFHFLFQLLIKTTKLHLSDLSCSHLILNCSKSAIETLKKSVKYDQS